MRDNNENLKLEKILLLKSNIMLLYSFMNPFIVHRLLCNLQSHIFTKTLLILDKKGKAKTMCSDY